MQAWYNVFYFRKDRRLENPDAARDIQNIYKQNNYTNQIFNIVANQLTKVENLVEDTKSTPRRGSQGS